MSFETHVPDFSGSNPVVTVSVSPQEEEYDVIRSLNSFSDSDIFGNIQWVQADTPRSSVFHFVIEGRGVKPVEAVPSYVLYIDAPSAAPFAVATASNKEKVCLPTGPGMQAYMKRIVEFNESWKKLKSCSKLNLLDYERPIFINDEMKPGIPKAKDLIQAQVYALFPLDVDKYLPRAKEILDSRFRRVLQRVKPQWHPFETREPLEESCYAHAVHDAKTHVEKRVAMKEDVEKHTGVKLSPADLASAQQGVGIPILGGHNRKSQGFTEPSPLFAKLAQKVCEIHLRGLVEEYIRSPDTFHEITTHTRLKPHSFQGTPLMSYNFIDHLMLLRVMALHPDGLFMFDNDDYEFPTIVGFRSQEPGGTWIDGTFHPKCRVSYMINGACEVMRTHVLDAQLLKHVTNFPPEDLKVPDGYNVYSSVDKLLPDVVGARIRHVTNPPNAYNDATMVVPSLIAKFKTKEYKQIMGQTEEVMRSVVPSSREFAEFWTKGFKEQEWVRKFAAKRGLHSAEELIAAMRKEGERIYAGDVQNFDGNVNWSMIEKAMSPLLSEKIMSLSKRIFNAPILGTTSTPSSTQLYYIVDRSDRVTAELASHLPSGWGCTSQAGRVIVPIMLNEMVLNAFSKYGLTIDLLFAPAVPGSNFSFQAALYNCAGDDHVIKNLVLWLVTGLSVDECHTLYNEEVKKYTTLKMAEETPPMCAGWLYHLDDNNRVISVSLSPGRMAVNTLTPEYPRTAIGLDASTRQYVESAIGTPIEDQMQYLRNAIVHDVYDLTDEELEDGVEEDLDFIDRNLANGADPREVIAEQLGVSPSKVDYAYTPEALLNEGVDESLLESYTLPIPKELTRDPARFINMGTIRTQAKQYPWDLENPEPIDDSDFDVSTFIEQSCLDVSEF